MRNPFTNWDYVLFVVYGYLILDVIINWNEYKNCKSPIHVFLLSTFLSVIIHKIVLSLKVAPDLPDLAKKCLDFFFYFMMTPGFITITVLGIYWQIKNSNETPGCIPKERMPHVIYWWIILLIILDLFLLLITVAKIVDKWRIFVFRRRIRRLVNAIDDIDDQVLNQFLLNMNQDEATLNDRVGLTIGEIEKLPQKAFNDNQPGLQDNSCVICFEDYIVGQNITSLPGCEHTYHSTCVNTWLLKNPLCPFCRSNVRNNLYLSLGRGGNQYQPVENLV